MCLPNDGHDLQEREIGDAGNRGCGFRGQSLEGPALTPQQVPQQPAPLPPPLVPLEATDSMLELPHPLLQQTEDQFLSPSLPCSSPLISFSPPLDQDDYLWGLDGGEGISDLFDSYDLGDLLIN
ncbi:transcription factor E2F2 [Eumetopias jubatus]|uniref:transcription factor E2F2 n=1 Tax=Eumetopias jubatus TaxID=34886 RepID=UPI001016BDB3|nr:transcription factor E2F2 [Eumetopias jubatus]